MTSGPPPASSWAAAPEFYTDENSGTRAVRRLLVRLGYTVHTPAELYGTRKAAQGAPDEDWLAKVGDRGWTVIGRDVKIYERPPSDRHTCMRGFPCSSYRARPLSPSWFTSSRSTSPTFAP